MTKLTGSSSRATLAKVAHLAGVSKTTASAVLGSGSSRFSEQTARRVREAADALGYRMNIDARSLRGHGNARIAVVLPQQFDAPPYHPNALFWPRVIHGFVSGCAAMGAASVMCTLDNLDEVAGGVNAILVIDPGNLDRWPKLALPYGLPIISAIELDVPNNHVVRHDLAAIAEEVACAVVSQGRRHLAWTFGQAPYLMLWTDFIRDACARHGLRFSELASGPSVTDAADFAEECRRIGADAIFGDANYPQEIVSGLASRGLAVNRDYTLITQSEGVTETAMNPPLPYLSACGEETGHVVTAAAIALISGKPASLTLPHRLVWRDLETE